ncbi:MAG: response regulator transcription factor [Anaerolineae bacterium]
MDGISVLIVDDHPVVRQGLRVFLKLQETIDLVGEAADGAEGMAKVRELSPDVVLMDLVMPGLDGVAAIREIRKISPKTQVLVLTSFADDERVFSSIEAGALGYLMKDASPQDVIQAIQDVSEGKPVLHPEIAKKLMREVSSAREEPPVERLTPREREVLTLIVKGYSNQEIARELGISEKTVKTHISTILSKLHLADRTQAAVYALREGLVKLE